MATRDATGARQLAAKTRCECRSTSINDDASSPLKKAPGKGTGPTTHADSLGNLVGRVPPRGEEDVFERAARAKLKGVAGGADNGPRPDIFFDATVGAGARQQPIEIVAGAESKEGLKVTPQSGCVMVSAWRTSH